MGTSLNRRWFNVASAPGSGDVACGSALAGFLGLGAAQDGMTFNGVTFLDGSAWEVRNGCTYTHGTTTLSRGTLEESSAGPTTPISLSASTTVMLSVSADAIRRFESAALEQAAGPNANTTMQVGKLYVIDGAALTADRTYTLPATAAVGDRVGVMMRAGSASYEVLLTAGSGDTLDGVAGGTEWSRIFIGGEMVVMRCVEADAAWMPEPGGRIPCRASLEEAAATSLSHSTFTKISLDTENFDIGAIADPTTNSRFNIRRSGQYLVTALVNVWGVDPGSRIIARAYVNGAAVVELARAAVPVSGTGVGSGSGMLNLSAGDYVELYGFWSITSGSGSKSTDTAVGARPYMTLSEVL